jgi:hypothetical protein
MRLQEFFAVHKNILAHNAAIRETRRELVNR